MVPQNDTVHVRCGSSPVGSTFGIENKPIYCRNRLCLIAIPKNSIIIQILAGYYFFSRFIGKYSYRNTYIGQFRPLLVKKCEELVHHKCYISYEHDLQRVWRPLASNLGCKKPRPFFSKKGSVEFCLSLFCHAREILIGLERIAPNLAKSCTFSCIYLNFIVQIVFQCQLLLNLAKNGL